MEVANSGSISRAATVLHIAQPALSRRMRQLEHELGTDLFDRTAGGVRLTSAGQRLYRRASAWAEEFARLQQTIQSDFAEDAGTLKLGMAAGPTTLLLGRVIGAARSGLPGEKLRVIELDRAALYEQVLGQQIAMAVSTEVEADDRITSIPLWIEDLFFVAPRPCLDGAALPPFVIPSHDPHMHAAVLRAANRLDVAVDDELIVTPTGSVKRLIHAGAACSVLPYSAVRTEFRDGSLHLQVVPGASITRSLFWLRKRPLSEPASCLLELIKLCVQAMLDERESVHLRPNDATANHCSQRGQIAACTRADPH